MPSPPVSQLPLEKQTPIASLRGLSAGLARGLGEQGVSGSDMATLLAEAVEAECVLCRITVSGADLISTCLRAGTDLTGVNEKLFRLQLGYCCRKGCPSSYYVVRFAPRPGIEWSELWDRAEPGFVLAAEPAPDKAVPRQARRNLFPAAWVERARKPVVLGLVSLLVLVLLFIGGCRFGLSPKSRVFIVSDVRHRSLDVSVLGEPSFAFSNALGP